ncbi:MAG: fasciclin domain-containing protein [Cyanobacteriota bacterium]|nr:fasciclin domain-containing protein [Cyanobacteriota bacterium]
MVNQMGAYWLKRAVCLLGIAGASALLNVPATAESAFEASSDRSVSETVSETQSEEVASASGTIVDIAATSGSFNTLVAALEAAGLVETLAGEGPFTVFAPTDEAFAALPPGMLEELLKPENQGALIEILTYHVVSGSVMSSDLESGSIPSLQGEALAVDLSNGVMVGDAMVVEADIPASNGTIHAIDTVMLPESVLQVQEEPTPDGTMTPGEMTTPEDMTLPEGSPMPDGMMMPEETVPEGMVIPEETAPEEGTR